MVLSNRDSWLESTIEVLVFKKLWVNRWKWILFTNHA